MSKSRALSLWTPASCFVFSPQAFFRLPHFIHKEAFIYRNTCDAAWLVRAPFPPFRYPTSCPRLYVVVDPRLGDLRPSRKLFSSSRSALDEAFLPSPQASPDFYYFSNQSSVLGDSDYFFVGLTFFSLFPLMRRLYSRPVQSVVRSARTPIVKRWELKVSPACSWPCSVFVGTFSDMLEDQVFSKIVR